MTPSAGVDRAAAVRQALLELVAEQGLHRASMGELARRARVAAGTIYLHYADKNALIHAVHAEVKRDLGLAASSGWDPQAPAERSFLDAWHRVYSHLLDHPERARFLLQVEASPYAMDSRGSQDSQDSQGGGMGDVTEVWSQMTEDLGASLVNLPGDVLFDLALGPAVRLAATAEPDHPDDAMVVSVARSCWRAITP